MPWRSRVSTGGAMKPKQINKRRTKNEREEAIRYFTGGRTHGHDVVKNFLYNFFGPTPHS
jgi:hypothetical protein